MPRTASETDGVRKNLRLTRASEKRIQDIKEHTDFVSESEVVRAALREYVKIMRLQMDGAEFFYRKSGSTNEVLLDPFYDEFLVKF